MVLTALRERAEAGSRLSPPYRSLAELLPNTKYQWPDAEPRALTEAAVVGRITEVVRGRGFILPDGDAPSSTPVDFEHPDALWRTVHATVEVEQTIGGLLPSADVVTGFAFGPRPSFAEIEAGLMSMGRVLLFLNRSPVFDYDARVLGTAADGELLGLVDAEGQISLPAASPAYQSLLDGARTLHDLAAAARRPERVIQVDHSNNRVDPTK